MADFLPTLIIKAKDFAAELTGHNVTDKDLRGEVNISKEHIDNNKAVRDMLFKRGVKPEHLPPAEDLKKLQRRLNADDKKVMKDGGKRRGNELHFKSNCDYRLLIILLTFKSTHAKDSGYFILCLDYGIRFIATTADASSSLLPDTKFKF